MSRIRDTFLEILRIEHGEPPLTFNRKERTELMKSISREDFLDLDPYEDKQKEIEDRAAKQEFHDDMKSEDEMIYGKD